MSDQTPSTALAPAAQDAVQNIRQAGAAAVALTKERNAVSRALAGMKFGSVRGENLSEHTRWMIARTCELYDADPGVDIEILGDRVYLKADYYARKLNALPDLVSVELRNIGEGFAKEMRRQADAVLVEAEKYGDPEMKLGALALVRQAQYADERRAHFQVPKVAEAAYEIVIVRAGMEPIRECNYAPNGPKDPVGRDRPAETARTRAYGRGAKKAIPSLRTAETRALSEGIKAEFEVIRGDQKAAQAALPPQDGPQALRVGAGEPQAARMPAEWAQEHSFAPQAAPMVEVGHHVSEHGQRGDVDGVREKRRFLDACKEYGVEDVSGFEFDVLGREADSADDYRELLAALEALHVGGAE